MEAAIIWIALIIIFAVVEIITVGLTSIWFAGGAVVALLVDVAGLGPVSYTHLDVYKRQFHRSYSKKITR